MLLIALSVVDEMLGCRLCAQLAVFSGMTRVEWFVVSLARLDDIVVIVCACCAPRVLMIVA